MGDTVQVFKMKDGHVPIPRNPTQLFSMCSYFHPESTAFCNWIPTVGYLDLSDFKISSMDLLLKAIYEDEHLTFVSDEICYFDFTHLCAFLLVPESFLIQKLSLSMSPLITKRKQSLALSYKLHSLNYPCVAKSILHCMRIPEIHLIQAKSSRHFLKKVKSASRFHSFFLTKIVPFCVCPICTEFRHERSIQLFCDDPDNFYESPHYGIVKSPLKSIHT